jgi:hypothetical protein
MDLDLPKQDDAVEQVASSPGTFQRIAMHVNQVRSESLKESFTNLARVNMFFWPGPLSSDSLAILHGEELPLPASTGQQDIDAIFSNRRFLKVFQESQPLSKGALTTMVKEEFVQKMPLYQDLFSKFMLTNKDHFTSEAISRHIQANPHEGISGPCIAINSGHDDESQDEPFLSGVRLALFANILVSAAADLDTLSPQIKNVTRHALQQRDALYRDKKEYYYFFIREALGRGSLYNRQILATGLLATCVNSSRAEEIMHALKLKWLETKLPAYDARLTPYDLMAKNGMYQPDFSKGSVTIRYSSPMDDATFDRIVAAIGGI